MAIHTEYQGAEEPGAMEHARKAVEEARAFTEVVGNRAASASRKIDLRGRVRKHPLAMLCAAAGVGYVLGGGLFTQTTARLLRYGLRIAVIPLVKSQLSGILGQTEAGETAAEPF